MGCWSNLLNPSAPTARTHNFAFMPPREENSIEQLQQFGIVLQNGNIGTGAQLTVSACSQGAVGPTMHFLADVYFATPPSTYSGFTRPQISLSISLVLGCWHRLQTFHHDRVASLAEGATVACWSLTERVESDSGHQFTVSLTYGRGGGQWIDEQTVPFRKMYKKRTQPHSPTSCSLSAGRYRGRLALRCSSQLHCYVLASSALGLHLLEVHVL